MSIAGVPQWEEMTVHTDHHGLVDFRRGRRVSLPTGTTGFPVFATRPGCACGSEQIAAVRTYLNEHFPGGTFRDLHAPMKPMREGVLAGRGDYHIVSLANDPPSHAVLLQEFLDRSREEVEQHLRQWDLAWMLRAYRIVVVGRDGVSSH